VADFGFIWFLVVAALKCSCWGVNFGVCRSASEAETCTEIVSSKGTVNYVAPRRRKTPKSHLYSATGC
jgi:hypothetical protein